MPAKNNPNLGLAACFQANTLFRNRHIRVYYVVCAPRLSLKIEFSRGSSRLSTKTTLFSMISDEGDFVRTWRYGRRRIRHKARKYRRFGGVCIILGWHRLRYKISRVISAPRAFSVPSKSSYPLSIWETLSTVVFPSAPRAAALNAAPPRRSFAETTAP